MSATYPSQRIDRHLSDNGLTSGNKDLNVLHESGTFYIQPPSGSVFTITELIITIADNALFSGNLFGARAVLATGLALKVKTSANSILADLDGKLFIKSNIHLAALGQAHFTIQQAAGSVMVVSIRLTDPIILANQDKIELNCASEDLTALTYFRIMARGVASSTPGASFDADIIPDV